MTISNTNNTNQSTMWAATENFNNDATGGYQKRSKKRKKRKLNPLLDNEYNSSVSKLIRPNGNSSNIPEQQVNPQLNSISQDEQFRNHQFTGNKKKKRRKKKAKLNKTNVQIVQQQSEDITNKQKKVFQNLKSVSNETNLSNLQAQRAALPIYSYQNEIVNAVRQNKTLILIGETACGKTTQIPQFLYQAGLLKNRIVGITQPRRVAAITIAERVAKEMQTELGELVGYCVRFEDTTSNLTKVKYLTDGMLLRESISDPLLSRYRIIILDEAHERTIHTDIMFGVVKKVQAFRQKNNLAPLKVIIMSATMDVDHFSKYFNDSPVFYLKGRQYPIQMMNCINPQSDYVFSALVTVFQIHQKEPEGDILVFCTGQEEIESMVKSIKETLPQLPAGSMPLMPFPLYAALPSIQQLNVFRPASKGVRKVIFSTNIAETSVTIPGVQYVIDTGMVKARTYHPGSGLDLLKVQRISKAQAWQRAGRAGREKSGFCYRLYTVSEYEKLKEHTVPEIQRCNLSNVVLQLLGFGITDVKSFDFMDRPADETLESAIDQLQLLGAVEKEQHLRLTELGKQMVAFPLEPKFSKAIISSKKLNCTDEILSIIAMLSVDSVIYVPANKREQATQIRKKFESNEGDHIMMLNIYRGYKSANGNKQWCQENFVNKRNMKIATDVRRQLSDLCTSAGIPPKSCGREFSSVRQCLSSGLFMNAAELQPGGHYFTIDTRQKVVIHPSSCLFNSKPAHLIFTELVQTSKCYMRNVSLIDPEWLVEWAPAYCNKKRLAIIR